MAHVPHLYVPRPWDGEELPLPPETLRHLRKVLRLRDGEAVTYTDGAGTIGTGRLAGDRIARGPEREVPRPRPEVRLAVAPPDNRDRARFCVEKLAELGVDRLLWIRTRHGGHRVPPPAKVEAWVTAALEQSRGAWRLAVDGPVDLADLPAPAWAADPGGPPLLDLVHRSVAGDPDTLAWLVIGPEGGLAADEIGGFEERFGLGPRILRVETAAVVAAAIGLAATGRLAVPPD